MCTEVLNTRTFCQFLNMFAKFKFSIIHFLNHFKIWKKIKSQIQRELQLISINIFYFLLVDGCRPRYWNTLYILLKWKTKAEIKNHLKKRGRIGGKGGGILQMIVIYQYLVTLDNVFCLFLLKIRHTANKIYEK